MRPLGKLPVWAELGVTSEDDVTGGFAPTESDPDRLNFILQQLSLWQYRDGIEALNWSQAEGIDVSEGRPSSGDKWTLTNFFGRSAMLYCPVRKIYLVGQTNIDDPSLAGMLYSSNGIDWNAVSHLDIYQDDDATTAWYQVAHDGDGHYFAWLNRTGGPRAGRSTFVFNLGPSVTGSWSAPEQHLGQYHGAFFDAHDQRYYIFGENSDNLPYAIAKTYDNATTDILVLEDQDDIVPGHRILFGASNGAIKLLANAYGDMWVTPNAITPAKHYRAEDLPGFRMPPQTGGGQQVIIGVCYSETERQFIVTTVSGIYVSPNGTFWQHIPTGSTSTLVGPVASLDSTVLALTKFDNPDGGDTYGLLLGWDSFRQWYEFPCPTSVPGGTNPLLNIFSLDGRYAVMSRHLDGANLRYSVRT